jgi:hypothetical protein
MTINTTIHDCSFSLKPLHESAYAFTTQFLSKDNRSLGEKTYVFKQCQGDKDSEIFDVFTKNGKCEPGIIDHLFTGSDVKYARKIAKYIEQKKPLLACLDLKDPILGYASSTAPVSIYEHKVCDFIRQELDGHAPEHAKKVHSLFHKELPIDFIFCEGTLKQDLLTYGEFTDHQIGFLNSSSGSLAFCKFTEFFMNGLKLGQELDRLPCVKAKNYIVPVSSNQEVFRPSKKSTVYYPPQYKAIYCPEGWFGKVTAPAFLATPHYDADTQFTIWSIEKKS